MLRGVDNAVALLGFGIFFVVWGAVMRRVFPWFLTEDPWNTGRQDLRLWIPFARFVSRLFVVFGLLMAMAGAVLLLAGN
jgi:hypothetical protein